MNLMVHYGDGLWRCDNSPILSDGGIDEPRKNPRHYDPNRPKQCVQEFG